VTDGCFQRFNPERASVLCEPRDGGREIIHFARDRSAAWRGLPIRPAVPDAERVRSDIIFDEPLVSIAEKP
jgi:hypothetical protein